MLCKCCRIVRAVLTSWQSSYYGWTWSHNRCPDCPSTNNGASTVRWIDVRGQWFRVREFLSNTRRIVRHRMIRHSTNHRERDRTDRSPCRYYPNLRWTNGIASTGSKQWTFQSDRGHFQVDPKRQCPDEERIHWHRNVYLDSLVVQWNYAWRCRTVDSQGNCDRRCCVSSELYEAEERHVLRHSVRWKDFSATYRVTYHRVYRAVDAYERGCHFLWILCAPTSRYYPPQIYSCFRRQAFGTA